MVQSFLEKANPYAGDWIGATVAASANPVDVAAFPSVASGPASCDASLSIGDRDGRDRASCAPADRSDPVVVVHRRTPVHGRMAEDAAQRVGA